LELDDDVLGRLEGRSSLGRIGIIVHGTAGLFDPGWTGKATLELSNLGRMPVALYPGMRICSMTFEQLSTKVAVPYRKKVGNKYAGQERPLASKLASETSK
jgi:dCTP deaminase